jgi:hypothetical protein
MTFEEEMIEKIEQALRDNPLGESVTIDGTTVKFADAIERLNYFRREVAKANGSKPKAASINLGGF